MRWVLFRRANTLSGVTSERLAGIGGWYLRAGLFGLPLAYSWNTYDHYIVPKLLVARLLVVGLLFLFIARALIARSLVLKRTPLDCPLLAFVASAVLSTVFAENLNVAVFGIYSRYDGLLTIVTYAPLFWLAVQTLRGPADARKLLWLLMAGGYLVAAIAIVQSGTASLALWAFVPAAGTLAHKNVLGEFGDGPALYAASRHITVSRQLLGYGPDSFGLVFPRFESSDLHQQWDKAHAETLQIAASQGVVGLAVYLFILVAFVRAFWLGRRNASAFAVFAGWVGYTATLQVNFSALAAAFPFWVFAAAALETWGDTPTAPVAGWTDGRRLAVAGSIAAAGVMIVIAAASFLPYIADAHVLEAVNADFGGRNCDALAPAQQAHDLWPFESVYAVEVGNVAFERGDWALARHAYGKGAALGTYNPFVYRNLALADRSLGLVEEGREAARKAVELNRFDAANQALLAQFEAAQP